MNCRVSHIRIIREKYTELGVVPKNRLHVKFLHSNYITAAPRAPLNLSVTRTEATEVDLEWGEPIGTWDDYTVYVRNISDDVIEQQIEGIQLTEATVYGLSGETEYEFWVVSVRDGIESSESDSVITETLPLCDLEIDGDVEIVSTVFNEYALDLDGSGDEVDIPTITITPDDHRTLEICFMFRDYYDTSSSNDIQAIGLLKDLNSVNFDGFLDYRFNLSSNGSPDFQLEDINGAGHRANLDYKLTQNTFYRLSVSFSPYAVIFYLDGNHIETTNPLENNFDITTIGRGYSAGRGSLDGIIDDFRLWDNTLSAEEIKKNTDKILSGNEEGLIRYYDCEDQGSQLTDVTSNNNHGTISGATYTSKTPLIYG